MLLAVTASTLNAMFCDDTSIDTEVTYSNTALPNEDILLPHFANALDEREDARRAHFFRKPSKLNLSTPRKTKKDLK